MDPQETRSVYRDEIDEFLLTQERLEEGLAREYGELRPWFWNEPDFELAWPLTARGKV